MGTSIEALKKAEAELILEKERRQEMASKAIEAKKRTDEWIAEAGHLAAEAFKISKEFKDMKVAFSQDAFNTGLGSGFEDCRRLIATRLPTVDLSFLDEDEEEAIEEPILSEPTAAQGRSKGEPMVVEVSSSPTVDVLASMPTSPIVGPSEAAQSLTNPPNEIKD